MNSISVTHVSSSQLKSELGKKCCSTPKSLIQCGRWYPLLYCCFGFFFFFHIRSLLMISQAPDYYTEEIKHNSSTGKNRNLFSGVTNKKQQEPIQTMLHNNCLSELYRSLSCQRSQLSIWKASKSVAWSLESLCSSYDCRAREKGSQQGLCLPPWTPLSTLCSDQLQSHKAALLIFNTPWYCILLFPGSSVKILSH